MVTHLNFLILNIKKYLIKKKQNGLVIQNIYWQKNDLIKYGKAIGI